MFKKITVMTFSLFFGALPFAIALDIPLDGGSGTGEGGQKIGYVDMDKIFRIYPKTKHAKEDYAKRLAKKKEVLEAKEKELQDITNRISVLETTFKEMAASQVDGSTAAAVIEKNPQSIVELKNELELKKLEMEEEKAKADEELAMFERQQSEIILGGIYKSLKELATEEQVNLVVDKSSILYGAGDIDLTDKLQQRVRGY